MGSRRCHCASEDTCPGRVLALSRSLSPSLLLPSPGLGNTLKRRHQTSSVCSRASVSSNHSISVCSPLMALSSEEDIDTLYPEFDLFHIFGTRTEPHQSNDSTTVDSELRIATTTIQFLPRNSRLQTPGIAFPFTSQVSPFRISVI